MDLETVKEDEEVYNWKEVKVPERRELEKELGETKNGREIIIAIDHGPNSKQTFDWALVHLCRVSDTIHLIHVVSS